MWYKNNKSPSIFGLKIWEDLTGIYLDGLHVHAEVWFRGLGLLPAIFLDMERSVPWGFKKILVISINLIVIEIYYRSIKL